MEQVEEDSPDTNVAKAPGRKLPHGLSMVACERELLYVPSKASNDRKCALSRTDGLGRASGSPSRTGEWAAALAPLQYLKSADGATASTGLLFKKKKLNKEIAGGLMQTADKREIILEKSKEWDTKRW